MRLFFLLIGSILFAGPICLGQNMVPNGSFESFSACPTAAGQIDRADGWSSYRKSPDYYNTCATGAVDIPNNINGFQMASAGDAYASIAAFIPNSNTREFMGVELTEKMMPGNCYYVEFKASLADIFSIGANRLGAQFFNRSYSIGDPAPINDTAQVYGNDIIVDKDNWTTVSGYFTAADSFQYMCIGNFFDSDSVDYASAGGGIPLAHYYIDEVWVENIPIGDLGNDTNICRGTSITLDATTPDADYLWQDGSTQPNFVADSAGIFWVEIILGNCTFRDSIEISHPEIATNFGADTTLCEGDSLTLAALTPGTFLWQDGSNDSILLVTTPGIYWVEITTELCTERDSITVDYETIPDVDLGNDLSLCEGDTQFLDVDTPGATYLWQDGSTLPYFEVTMAGEYWVSVTLSETCSATDTVVYTFNPYPVVDLGEDTSICAGDTLQFNFFQENTTYLWQDGAVEPDYEIYTSGTYWVAATLETCTSRDTLIADVVPIPTFDLGNDTLLCEGDELVLSTSISNADYLWQDGSSDSIFTTDTAGLFWVEVTLSELCSARDSLVVEVSAYPAFSLGMDTSICEQTSIVLNASTPGATYQWQDGTSEAELSADQEGFYWVDVTLNESCTTRDSIYIDVLENNIDLGEDFALCSGESQTLSVEGYVDAMYLWQDGSMDSTLTASTPGIYWVIVTAGSCDFVDSVSIASAALPDVNLGVDTSICAGSQLVLSAENEQASYFWNDGTTSAELMVDQEGWYVVTVENTCGSVTDSVYLSVEDCLSEIPNVFSPNGDGVNDLFIIPGIDNTWDLKVFNRSGVLIFQSERPAGHLWDGRTFSGEEAINGVYFYILNNETTGSKKSGYVQVIR